MILLFGWLFSCEFWCWYLVVSAYFVSFLTTSVLFCIVLLVRGFG